MSTPRLHGPLLAAVELSGFPSFPPLLQRLAADAANGNSPWPGCRVLPARDGTNEWSARGLVLRADATGGEVMIQSRTRSLLVAALLTAGMMMSTSAARADDMTSATAGRDADMAACSKLMPN